MPRLPSQNVQPQDPEHVSSCPQLQSYEPPRESVSNKEARINSENENNGILLPHLDGTLMNQVNNVKTDGETNKKTIVAHTFPPYRHRFHKWLEYI